MIRKYDITSTTQRYRLRVVPEKNNNKKRQKLNHYDIVINLASAPKRHSSLGSHIKLIVKTNTLY